MKLKNIPNNSGYKQKWQIFKAIMIKHVKEKIRSTVKFSLIGNNFNRFSHSLCNVFTHV